MVFGLFSKKNKASKPQKNITAEDQVVEDTMLEERQLYEHTIIFIGVSSTEEKIILEAFSDHDWEPGLSVDRDSVAPVANIQISKKQGKEFSDDEEWLTKRLSNAFVNSAVKADVMEKLKKIGLAVFSEDSDIEGSGHLSDWYGMPLSDTHLEGKGEVCLIYSITFKSTKEFGDEWNPEDATEKDLKYELIGGNGFLSSIYNQDEFDSDVPFLFLDDKNRFWELDEMSDEGATLYKVGDDYAWSPSGRED